MKSREELELLADEVIRGDVFMANTWEAFETAFVAIVAFLDPESMPQGEDEPVAFYEYMSKAQPGTVNGYPIFGSARYLTRADWEIFFPIYEEKYRAFHGTDVPKTREELEAEGEQ